MQIKLLANHRSPSTYFFTIFTALFCMFYSGDLFAASILGSVPDVSTILSNLVNSVGSMNRMVTAIAYVLGMAFIVQGVMKLKQFGEQRSMAASHAELKGPLIYLLVGTMLLYLPTSVNVGLNTFWTDANPYGYNSSDFASNDQWDSALRNCFTIIQLIGTIAFIRGLVMLTHLSGHQSQHGTLGKAIMHMVAGICCINLYGFVRMLAATVGYSGSW